ncbi:two-component response regulator ARR18-like isoform X4 [Phaseolus vulgaris]|uniref:two-component response regulator ARR18-like isoform X4 n=1 Tax=Phaseolus vulgaris TaxID=3885 RepID=UPI0035C9F82A
MKLVAEIWSHDFGKIQCIKGRQRQRWPNIQMPLSPYQKMTVVEDKMDDPRDEFSIRMRVLAFDDESTCLMNLETMLRRCEYQVQKCHHPRLFASNHHDKSSVDKSVLTRVATYCLTQLLILKSAIQQSLTFIFIAMLEYRVQAVLLTITCCG